MRTGLAILLVALLAGVGSARAAECCHHVSSTSTNLCLNFECEPEFAISVHPAIARLPVPAREFQPVLATGHNPFEMRSVGRPALLDSVVLRLVPGKLFLRNGVLLI
jgi:hypothetical protein